MYRLSLIILLFTSLCQAQTVGTHGENFKLDCKLCHNVNGWKIDRKTLTFNHDTTGFELGGQHKQIDCKACHKNLKFTGSKTTCVSCHQDIHGMTVGDDCARCHQSTSWLVDNIPELHEQNGFPLVGVHTVLSCADCHKSESTLKWNRIGNECINCHRTDYTNTQNPNHQLSGFSTNCIECHDPMKSGWGGNFSHDMFPLKFGHDIAECKACHKTSNFAATSPECVSCHKKDFDATTLPNHQGSGFSNNCIECHKAEPIDWKVPGFHDKFSLTLGHDVKDCKACHKTDNFSNTSTQCVSCHQTDFNNTTLPNHVGSNFSTNCIDCHNPSPIDWKVPGFHDKFSLTFGHNVSDCKACHKTDNFSNTSTQCISCHQTDFNNTTLPNHVGSNFSTNCIDCHNPTPIDWKVSGYHDAFPLTQGHDVKDCKACHKTDNFSNTSTECVSCHKTDYDNTIMPNHSASNFSTNCIECHSPTPVNWTIENFHSSFPLKFGHDIPDCKACHKSNDYSAASPECVSCHQTDFNNTTLPNHSASKFSTNCTDCHSSTPINWTVSGFHDMFPLTQGHDVKDCKTCHKTDDFTSTSPVCVTCHQTDFNNTKLPNHSASNFSTNCIECHAPTPINWNVSGYHDLFPLTKGHDIKDCKACHKTDDFTNLSPQCISCHTSDFNNTTNPNHVSLGFSTTCTECHTTDPGWESSLYKDHDAQFFPIYSGKHQGEWTKCTDCHTTSGNYKAFTCIQCHEHSNASKVNNDHKGVKNYTYDSNACYSCHPKGRS